MLRGEIFDILSKVANYQLNVLNSADEVKKVENK